MDKEELQEGLKYIEAVEKIEKEIGEEAFVRLVRMLETPYPRDNLKLCKEFYHKVAEFYRNERSKAQILIKLENYYEKTFKGEGD